MNYSITYSKRFKKNYKKLSKVEKRQFRRKLEYFIDNPYHPSLRTKKIKGTDDLWESSVNMDIRLIWYYQNQKLIMFLDIDHHDILEKF